MRVSSRDQNEDRQRIALLQAGVPENWIYLDKQSGRDFVRPGYRTMLKKLKEGDRLVIKSIDRLGRDYKEILEQWRLITTEMKVEICVLDMPLLDTRQRDLTGVLIADIVLQLLSYVAQTEREFIHQRQAEGIEAAKNRGVVFGRPSIRRPPNYDHIKKQWEQESLSARKAGMILGVSYKTFLKWTRSDNMDSFLSKSSSDG